MNAGPMNPFRPTRWEHHQEGQQLIWYSKFANTLAGEKSYYVNGSRGSGKTTLLRSICWEDLTRNTSLRMQKTFSDLVNIGCYIRFPDHLSSALNATRWPDVYPNAPEPELELHRYFSLLVELTCAERAINASHELRVEEFANIIVAKELEFVRSLFAEYSELRNFSEFQDATPRTLPDTARVLRKITRRMNQAAGRGTVRELSDSLPAREPGEFLGFVAKSLSSIVRLQTKQGWRAPGYKFCLDDCEVLNAAQQVSLNTLVRVCKAPVSWVISYVGSQFENRKTYIAQQQLSDADRRIESLDDRSEGTFKELCQAVVSLRLLFSVSENVRKKRQTKLDEFFPLPNRLGSRTINEMMGFMIRKSTRPVARTIRRCAQELLDHLPPAFRKEKSGNTILPYYQAYILLHWQPESGTFKANFSKADEAQLTRRVDRLASASDEAWMRRKQRGAMLHLSSVLGAKRLPLAGEDVILSLADGSIRDFLEIMGFIYEAYATDNKLDVTKQESLDRFVLSGSQIAADTQTIGIYDASNSYLSGVGIRGEKEFDVALRLIEGLGHLTSILQTDSRDPSVLATTERGIFSVQFETLNSPRPSDATRRERTVWNTIRNAELSGYVRTTDSVSRDVLNRDEPSGGNLIVRLHRRFSPTFHFSFRGPYEQFSINAADLWQLFDRNNSIDPRAWAESMARKAPLGEQAELPLNWSDRND